MTQIKDLMTGDLKKVNPDTAIQEAANTMKTNDIGALPVMEDDKVVGMLTDRDITIRVVAEGADPTETTVQKVMTDEVHSVYEDQDIQEVTQLMKDKQIRRVVVMTRDGKATGICSLGDLANATKPQTGGDVLQDVSKDKPNQ